MTQNKRYIPLDAVESAVLTDANTLLPIKVYERLAELIGEAVKKAEAAKGKSLNQLREHNAISIDGARGTGKTAVLVNLKSYLNQDKHKDILNKVHILDPVDPTLLENGESLFLHIIVAAVLHDNEVKEAQRKDPNKARHLNQTLEKLVHSLESVETQHERHGMDKVRAMYSNKHLADCVQDFFREVLGLLGKQLLILPIDDVDTSLNRAFENLEIVRRYLATPYVLPIVCGDRSLYDEITWRDFHWRLTKDSKHLSEDAYERAVELAVEYQRKILPFPRRITMPEVSGYWLNPEIRLGRANNEAMPLRNFIAWLEIFLAGPVNGLSDSHLLLPIPSMRALTQLLNQCRQLIPVLPKSIREADTALQVKRAWQMPDVPEKAIEEFEKEYQRQHVGEKRAYGSAYLKFSAFATQSVSADVKESWSSVDRQAWILNLDKHFSFEPTGGPAHLVLQARLHWHRWSDMPSGQRNGSVFDTPLFQPRLHDHVNFQLFDKKYDLSDWKDSLEKKEKLPKVWFRGLETLKTILSYPLAEVGCNIDNNLQKQLKFSRVANSLDWTNALSEISPTLANDVQLSRKAGLLLNLLAEHYFYKQAQRTVVLNIGRIFELIIASLLGDLELSDLQRILHSAPFFSAKSQVQEIAVSEQQDTVDGEETTEDEDSETTSAPLDIALGELQQAIAQWRNDFDIAHLDISPWLIYKVFEKVYAMVSDNADHGNGESKLDVALNKAGLVFYATWSAFGSFEKGRLFGLPELVTGVALRNATNFEQHDHFKMNIGHLAPHKRHFAEGNGENEKNNKSNTGIYRREFGAKTRTITNALAFHPLGMLIDEIMRLVVLKNMKSNLQDYSKSRDKINDKGVRSGGNSKSNSKDDSEFTERTNDKGVRSGENSKTNSKGDSEFAEKTNDEAWSFLLRALKLHHRTRDLVKIELEVAELSKSYRHKILNEMLDSFTECDLTYYFQIVCLMLDDEQMLDGALEPDVIPAEPVQDDE